MGPNDEVRAAEAEVARIQAEMRELAIQTGLDIAGTFDPTPISDIAGAGYSISRGDWTGAGLSLLGVIPYFGDVLGKSTKAARLSARLAELNARLGKALSKLKVSDGGIAAARAAGQAKLTVTGKLTQTGRQVADTAKLGTSRTAISFFDTLSVIRNPRRLAKHHGPVPVDKLRKELDAKGFQRIDTAGKAVAQGSDEGESSFVFVRKVLVEEKEYFEAVRIDPKLPAAGPFDRRLQTHTMKGEVRPTLMTPGGLQAGDRPFRQNHIRLEGPEAAGLKNGEVAKQLNDGKIAKGSDLSHFHHEMFPATRKNLDEYLKPRGDVKGLIKRDSGGYAIWDGLLYKAPNPAKDKAGYRKHDAAANKAMDAALRR